MPDLTSVARVGTLHVIAMYDVNIVVLL